MIPCNYHTHTCFCDGKNTPEEMVLSAIALGCKELGFSGHSHTPFDASFCMTKENTLAYIETVKALQEKYAGQIKIYLGIEQDYHSPESTEGYDYIIGSVHYVEKDGVHLPIDKRKQVQIDIVNQYYGGDFYGFAEDYFALVGDVYSKTRCHIIGHFDLIAKFNRDGDLFDTRHPRYQAAARKAMESLLKCPAILEVNTGAMSRGYTTEPYPNRDFLAQWLESGKPIIFSSDCHSKDHILFGYDVFESHIDGM